MGTATAKSAISRARKSTAKRARGKLAPRRSALIGAYREPLGGRPLVLASLPLHAVQPTPFQRDLSPTHAKRLASKIDETAAFLDPLIVVRGEDGRLWTPKRLTTCVTAAWR
jgi:hypothetical protein